jgi:hypothetical protein
LVKASDPIPFPPHAYVPGKTPRHAEGWFDDIKSSVTEMTPNDRLHETRAFRAGMLFFEHRYYWECHEVLEAVWLRTKAHSVERHMVQALIQLANARLKLLMGKPRAARRLCDMVLVHLAHCPTDAVILTLDPTDVREQVEATLQQQKLHYKTNNT